MPTSGYSTICSAYHGAVRKRSQFTWIPLLKHWYQPACIVCNRGCYIVSWFMSRNCPRWYWPIIKENHVIVNIQFWKTLHREKASMLSPACCRPQLSSQGHQTQTTRSLRRARGQRPSTAQSALMGFHLVLVRVRALVQERGRGMNPQSLRPRWSNHDLNHVHNFSNQESCYKYRGCLSMYRELRCLTPIWAIITSQHLGIMNCRQGT